MAISYAPIDDMWIPPTYTPPDPQIALQKMGLPVSDNTECNYIVMFFIGSVILLGIMDSLRR